MTATPPHAVPHALLERFCQGDDDLDDLARLRRAALSRSMLLLRAIRDLLLEGRHGNAAVAHLAAHVAALAGLQRAHPDVVEPLLRGPHFVAWAAHCIRRLTNPARSDAAGRPGLDVPLSVDLAHLGCLVVAAALRAAVEVEVEVEVRDEAVVIPAIGKVLRPGAATGTRAVLRSAADRLSVRIAGPGSEVVIPSLMTATDDWLPLGTVGNDVGGDRWEVIVDVTDPYFRCFELPRMLPDVNGAAELRRLFGPACAVLSSVFSRKTSAMAADIRCLVPLATGGNAGLSATSVDAPGAVALTAPSSSTGLAATLVHEHQHFKLNALDALIGLCEDGPGRYYSPWRDDSRPASGLLHGAYAFLGLGEFWRRLCRHGSQNRVAPHLQFARITRQLAIACTTLRRCSELTDAGTELVRHMAARADTWEAPGHSVDVQRIADDLVADHHVRWRLRALTPPASWVRPWAATVLDLEHDDMPVGEPVTTGPGPERGLGSESDLSASARLWAAGRRSGRLIDRLLLDGDYASAVSTVTGRLIATGTLDDRATLDDWTTLAVAARRTDLGVRCPLLCTHPEMVRAAFVEARRRLPSIGLDDVLGRLPAEPPSQVAGTSISLSVRM